MILSLVVIPILERTLWYINDNLSNKVHPNAGPFGITALKVGLVFLTTKLVLYS